MTILCICSELQIFMEHLLLSGFLLHVIWCSTHKCAHPIRKNWKILWFWERKFLL